MDIFTPKLINSPNRGDLFDADKRTNIQNLRIFSEAVNTYAWFNPETKQAEIVKQ